ncbi:hypothetical protein E5A73_20600 [Sphingomonas gei]|uniref:General secretion pathway protein GspM n=1 Tax=Sphingomonas gei TaxID=1395960 RepID=A0A4S1WYT7_9SPHN|nr:type II secretion system protein GspM [Sphingomonas gei]TGX48708.1 hypothetical protein E5A73_20600 [Sphingomonas gei]
MRPTSARERRLIALLILTALVAALYFLVVAPIVAGFESRADRLDRLALTYTRNLRTIAAIPRLRRHAESQRAAAASFAAAVPNAEAGREWLRDRLQRAVEGAGGEFREGDDVEASPGWVRASAEARMTLTQLIAALAHLQNQPPWLIVETVSVTGGNAIAPGQSPVLEVEIEATIPLRPAAAR